MPSEKIGERAVAIALKPAFDGHKLKTDAATVLTDPAKVSASAKSNFLVLSVPRSGQPLFLGSRNANAIKPAGQIRHAVSDRECAAIAIHDPQGQPRRLSQRVFVFDRVGLVGGADE